MGFRFRKSITLAPGIRLNFSSSGTSMTVGPRGASINFGSRGAYLNAGVPGLGLYSRTRLAPSQTVTATGISSNQPVRSQAQAIPARVIVHDDGKVEFQGSDGVALDEQLVRALKRQHGEEVRQFLEAKARELNSPVDALERIHWFTPKPDDFPKRLVRPFEKPAPARPAPLKICLWDRMFGRRAKIEAENSAVLEQFLVTESAWNRAKLLFESLEVREAQRFDRRLRTDVEFMEKVLADHLHDIHWPRETIVSF